MFCATSDRIVSISGCFRRLSGRLWKRDASALLSWLLKFVPVGLIK